MDTRPIIKIKPEPIDIVFDVLGWTALFTLWAYIIMNYQTLPDVVPIHFGAGGVPDGYGSKETTFLSAIIPTILFLGMAFLQRKPHIFNYLNEITPENAERQYRNGARMVRVMKMCICLIFIAIEYSTTVALQETGKGDVKWVFLAAFVLIQLPLFYFLIKMSSDK